MIKKLPIKYTTMAIYIDEHIFDEDKHVQEIVYDYLVHIAYMLILKHKLFNNIKDSEQYAHYLATDVYLRMVTPRQFLPEDDPQYLTPIKSSLNYIKQLLYPRKVAFAQKEFGFTTKANDIEAYNVSRDYVESSIQTYYSSMKAADIRTYITDVPRTLKYILSKCPYSNDKVILHYLYISVLASFIRNFTYSKKQKRRLARLVNPRLIHKLETLSKQCYSENTLNAPITYGLDEEFFNIVAVYLQKFKQELTKDMEFIVGEYDVPDEMMNDIMMNNLSEILEERDK